MRRLTWILLGALMVATSGLVADQLDGDFGLVEAGISGSFLPTTGGSLSGNLVLTNATSRIYNSAGPLSLGAYRAGAVANTSADVTMGGRLEVVGAMQLYGEITHKAMYVSQPDSYTTNFRWGKGSTQYTALSTVGDNGTTLGLDCNAYGANEGNCSLLLTTYANKNLDHGNNTAQTNPTLKIYSAATNATATTWWGSVAHSGAAGADGYFNYTVGSGHHLFAGGATMQSNDCYGVLYTNSDTTLSRGELVDADTATDYSVVRAAANSIMFIGVVRDASCARGAACNICTLGRAQCLLKDGTACARGEWVGSTDVAGRCECRASGPGAIHDQEAGHALTTNASGTNVIGTIHYHNGR